jgi:hypothetical protein
MEIPEAVRERREVSMTGIQEFQRSEVAEGLRKGRELMMTEK